ncbi:MAG: sugar ABC transporter permease [Chloroflexi bacterium]|nr:sugar ABC transporter permease [Chloroflexota bacterium]
MKAAFGSRPLSVDRGGFLDPATTSYARRSRRVVQRWTTIVLLLLPASVLYVVFVLVPVVQAAFFSFFRWNGLGPLTDFIGFDNYARALSDGVFRGAIAHNFVIVALSLLIQLPIALGLALLVGRRLPGRVLFRTVFFLPYVLSDVVTGVMWSEVYNPQVGALTALGAALIPGFKSQALLGHTETVLFAIFAVMTWKYFGFHLVLYVAGLQQIPPEIEDAARIDGASNVQVLRRITLPLLGSTIRISAFLSVIGSLQYFDLIWVMSTGGPVGASETMVTYLYKFGLQRLALGYGSAVATVLFVLCLAFSLLYQRTLMREDVAGGVSRAV